MSISELLQKRKWKLKIALAAVSDPGVYIVAMEISPGLHVLTQPKHMVKK